MGINLKLFHLGNKVVEVSKKLNKTFPRDCFGNNELGDCFNDLLNLINEIRLSFQEAGDPRECYNLNIECNEQELLSIKEHMEVLKVQYGIEKN